jgi:hypothetical protein
MTSKRTIKRIEAKRVRLRDQLWPDLEEKELWNRKTAAGFITIPRTMPLIGKILNELSEQGALSSTYLELWCRSHDEAIVEVRSPQENSFFAGFIGQRSVQTWTRRMRELQRLGFIEAESGPWGEFSYVLLWNPHKVISSLVKKKLITLKQDSINALKARLNDVGAKDVDGIG